MLVPSKIGGDVRLTKLRKRRLCSRQCMSKPCRPGMNVGQRSHVNCCEPSPSMVSKQTLLISAGNLRKTIKNTVHLICLAYHPNILADSPRSHQFMGDFLGIAMTDSPSSSSTNHFVSERQFLLILMVETKIIS